MKAKNLFFNSQSCNFILTSFEIAIFTEIIWSVSGYGVILHPLIIFKSNYI